MDGLIRSVAEQMATELAQAVAVGQTHDAATYILIGVLIGAWITRQR